MAVTCSGTIRDPSGAPIANLKIILRAIGTNSVVLDGGELIYTTDANGAYSFTIENGLYGAYIDYKNETFLGEFFINNDTVDGTLNTYLLTVDLGSAAIQSGIQFQEFVNDASEQANIATAQATIATNEANRAQGIADNLGIFPPRTLADSNAERAINSEIYAASGFVHFGKHRNDGSNENVNEGLYVSPTIADTFFMGVSHASETGKSKTNGAFTNIAGAVSEIVGLNTPFAPQTRLKVPPAPDGTVTYDSATGVTVTHTDAASAFAAETATNKVVTAPYDLFGLEAWLEEITVGNPYAYDRGIIQSQATNIEGVVTVATNRPATYYAVFDGDSGSNGRGIDWLSLTETQRNAISSNPLHNIYYDSENARWLQWRIRQRTHRGAGNGNWSNIDPNTSDLSASGLLGFSTNAINRVSPQGANNTPNTDVSNFFYTPRNGPKYGNSDVAGAFVSAQDTAASLAINGECYFLPMGIVPRLNQGAYHPSFNPMGTSSWGNVNFGTNGNSGWFESGNGGSLGLSATSTLDCFVNKTTGVTANGSIAGAGLASRLRPDGKFYDAIAASGQGGVIDNRLSTFEPKATPIVTDGTWRGMENLVRTRIDSTTQTTNASINQFAITDATKYTIGDKVILVNASNTFDVTANVTSVSASTVVLDQTFSRTAGNTHVVIEHELDRYVEDAFLHIDVFGVPSNILLTPNLADGWYGSWITLFGSIGSPQIDVPFTRKVLNTSNIPRQFSTNNGLTWVSATATNSLVTNSYQNAPSEAYIGVYSYTASSKIVEPTSNKEVFNNARGLGNIFITSDYRPEHGALFAESVTDLILKSDAAGITRESTGYIKYLIETTLDRLTHSATDIVAPANSSRAVKIATYQVKVNDQLFLGFVVNTMTHNGTDWGDTGSMFIPTSERSTFPDSNGTTQVARVEILNKPYGWFKNEI